MRIPFVLAAAMVAAAAPASAWELYKSEGYASAGEREGQFAVNIICHRGRGNLEFTYTDLEQIGDGFDEIQKVTLWIKLPDGRTGGWSIDVGPEGPVRSGIFAASPDFLDFFANGESLQIDARPANRVIFRSDMKGTGAARIAFGERCGI